MMKVLIAMTHKEFKNLQLNTEFMYKLKEV